MTNPPVTNDPPAPDCWSREGPTHQRADADAARRTINVAIVAPVRLYREGLADALRREPWVGVVGAASSVGDALLSLLRWRADVLLVDAATPNAKHFVRRVIEIGLGTPIVAIAVTEEDDGEVLHWIEAGAAMYLRRDAPVGELLRAIEYVARGEAECSPVVVARIFKRLAQLSRRHDYRLADVGLTRREVQVADLLGQGLSNKEIAGRLCIGIATVKHHVHSILHKSGVPTRGAAAAKLHHR